MNKIFLCLILIYSIIFTTACPQKAAIRRADEAAFQLSGSINDAQKALEAAFAQNLIGKNTAIKLNDYLRDANEGSKKLLIAVVEARAAFGNGKIPQTKLDALNLILSEQVATPVLRILDELKIVNANVAPALFAALASVKTLIIIISSVFPRRSSAMIALGRSEIYG